MTEGPIGKQIILFSIPLLLGNLFQQLYNTADSMIVGNFVGKDALAAVGSSASLINLMVGAFVGVAVGAGVIISQCYGAKDMERLDKAVHTTIAFAIFSGLFLTVFGMLATPTILRWMGTPDTVIESSITYFRIFFAGSLGATLYNMGCGVLRALGDSRRPLYYLIVASLLNIVLDLVFVAVFDWGVAGAAIATIIAQFVSAILTMRALIQEKVLYRFRWRKVRFHGALLQRIVEIGLPGALQNAVVSLSNVVVQSNINSFGDLAMAGCGAYMKVDGFAVLPVMSFSMAMTTFVGQNMGAKQYDRVKKGTNFGIIAGMVTIQTLACGVMFFAPQLINLFNGDPEVIAYGAKMARAMGPFYFLTAISQVIAGALRGAGISHVPMMVLVACWCVLRIVWLTVMVPIWPDINTVFMGYSLTWFASAVILFIIFKKSDWIHYMEKKHKQA
ncbi:MAG: MATE family efflux transporter [Lachnospiraceae bacterium]|nr:MATE family efflux transporter [Lachnospiraceae bacterium]